MRFTERLEAIPSLYRWLALPLLVLLLAVPYWYFSYQPRTEEIAALEQTIAAQRTKLERFQRISANYDRFKAEVVELEAELRKLLQFLPKSQEIPSLIRQISALALTTGLQVDLIRPAGETPKEFYAEVPISVEVKGPYHAVGQFFDSLSRLPRIVSVSSVEMQASSQATKCLATTFRYLEEEEVNEQAESEANRRRQ